MPEVDESSKPTTEFKDLEIPGAGHLRVEWWKRDPEGRNVFAWMILNAAGGIVGFGDDISSGVDAPVDPDKAMGGLLSFLGACAEASDDGENANLFPPSVREWAQAHSDELAMAGLELEEKL